MRFRRSFFIFIILMTLRGSLFAGVYYSLNEFKSIAHELSTKVDFFSDLWRLDPEAKIFGGAVKDYLWWLKRQLAADSRNQFSEALQKLRDRKSIELREFVFEESDIDVFSQVAGSMNSRRYHVRKIESLSPDRFLEGSESLQSEINQGFLPTEKLLLSKNGMSEYPYFGAGISEIFSGKISVQFSDPDLFLQSTFAKRGLNHPILLVLRYIRARAQAYFSDFGKNSPGMDFPGMDFVGNEVPEVDRRIREIVTTAKVNFALRDFLKNENFGRWFNSTIEKSMMGFSNPHAAIQLLDHFGISGLIDFYGAPLKPINHLLFLQSYDHQEIEQRIRDMHIDSAELYISVAELLPDYYLFHGTNSSKSYRNILMQGVLPSESGSAGSGLYAVASKNLEFAVNHTGGDRGRVIKLKIKPSARIIDISTGLGERAFKQFGSDADKFSEIFGVDILKYPYNPPAYVIKNSAVIEGIDGLEKVVISKAQFFEELSRAESTEEVISLLQSMNEFTFTADEMVHFKYFFSPSFQGRYQVRVDNPLAKSLMGPSDLIFVFWLDLVFERFLFDRDVSAFRSNFDKVMTDILTHRSGNISSLNQFFRMGAQALYYQRSREERLLILNALNQSLKREMPLLGRIPGTVFWTSPNFEFIPFGVRLVSGTVAIASSVLLPHPLWKATLFGAFGLVALWGSIKDLVISEIVRNRRYSLALLHRYFYRQIAKNQSSNICLPWMQSFKRRKR